MRLIGSSAEQATYDAMRASVFTRVAGRPARKYRDSLKEEVKIVLTRAKVPEFIWTENVDY